MGITEIDSSWRPQLLDFRQVQQSSFFEEGFSRPDWTAIGARIESTASQEDLDQAWTEAAMQWVLQVRTDLGGDYRVRCSKEFILLSAIDLASASEFLSFAEKTLASIYKALRDAAWQWKQGKHVILLFTEEDDYYQYVSFFHREGVHPASGGCLIPTGYVHLAMPYGDGRTIRRVLAHELVHNSLVHLQLPAWLNEGLALSFERTAVFVQDSLLDDPYLRDRILAFWNSENIQKFWSGVSFWEPGDPHELSYSLAEILLKLLLSGQGDLGSFIKEARWEDAGQTAALDHFGTDLGQLAATFLGEGDWRPNRKAMIACWEAAKQRTTAESALSADGKTAKGPAPSSH
jgi:hypothetical protein